MKFKTLSPKQAEIFKFMASDYDALICDGAVRSGKTTMMAIAFIEWAMNCFDGENLGICGKTVRSAERNIISVIMSIDSLRKKYGMRYNRTISLLTLRRGDTVNYFHVFGGKDESSYMLIQGITLHGVMFDEVALMPESFVNQAIARTISFDDAKLWFNCNPENPAHWFYKGWILCLEQHNAKRLKFLMEDNPSLSEKAIKKAKASFSGVFYDRYINGLWVAAEGVIYRLFADAPGRFILKEKPQVIFSTIGLDFGGNKSAHAFSCTGFTRRLREIITLDEVYTKDELNPQELENMFVGFVQKQIKAGHRVSEIRADNAEPVLIRGIQNALVKAGIGIPLRGAIKGRINERIRLVSMLMSEGRYKIMEHCANTIDALSMAVWDSKKYEDVRLDDGSTNIDSLDAMEYSIEPYMKQLIDWGAAD